MKRSIYNYNLNDTITDIDARLDILLAAVDQLRAAKYEAEQAKPKAWPQEGDNVYARLGSGQIVATCYKDSGYRSYLDRGRVTRTREEAETQDAIELAIVRVNNVIRDKYPFEAHWNIDDYENGHFYYHHGMQAFRCGITGKNQLYSPLAFFNPSDFKSILAECEADLRLIFGVTK